MYVCFCVVCDCVVNIEHILSPKLIKIEAPSFMHCTKQICRWSIQNLAEIEKPEVRKSELEMRPEVNISKMSSKDFLQPRYANTFLHFFFENITFDYYRKKSWKSKFSSILAFRSVGLEKTSQTIFFKRHITILF